MKRGFWLFWIFSLPAFILPAHAASRGQNLVPNPGFETDDAWASDQQGVRLTYDDTVAHRGHRSLRISNNDMVSERSASLAITLDPPVHHPFRVSGWSRAAGVDVRQDYSVYLDLVYSDDTPLWGQKADFTPGTHDWERCEFQFDVAKPVKAIRVFVLFRKARGTVWFDDLDVSMVPLEIRDLRVTPGLFGNGVGVTGTTTLPGSWSLSVESTEGRVGGCSGAGSVLRYLSNAELPPEFTVRVSATDGLLNETVTREERFARPAPELRRDYAVWTESSMRRLMPSAMPDAVADSPRADVALAGNEYEGFQVGLLAPPSHGLKDIVVERSDLVCAASGRRIGMENIEFHQVGYVKLDRVRPHPGNATKESGWWPDALLPVERFDVAPGFAQALWVTVYAPAGTPAGDYVGQLVVRPEHAAPTTVAVRAHVYGFSLPERSHLKTAFALMDGFLERVYGKPLDAGLRRAYGDYVLKHRLNPDDISRTAPPELEDLQHYDARLNAFNVLNMVEERGDKTWVCWSPLEAYTPAFKQRLLERLDPYVERLRKTKLTDRAYVYTFDERDPEFNPVMREYFGMVKQRYPEIPTLTTAHVALDPEALTDLNIDWICPTTPGYQYEAAERCRAAGHQVWAYVCMGPGFPYANWLCDNPLIEARLLWWQAYHQKMDGFLYWGLNIWDLPHNDKPIDPSKGPLLDWSVTTGGECDWLHGDGRLLYAGPKGPIGSIRLENIRDGLEDYEYLVLLATKLKSADAARTACVPVTDSLTHFTREPKVLSKARAAIAEQIVGGDGR